MKIDLTLALCRSVDGNGEQVYDPEMWFPLSAAEEAIHEPRLVCERCPIKAECLDAVMAAEGSVGTRYGTFGGEGPLQRKNLRKARLRYPCGTVQGYRRHRYRGEVIDAGCAQASKEYERDRAARRRAHRSRAA